jgi:hypothetical protein
MTTGGVGMAANASSLDHLLRGAEVNEGPEDEVVAVPWPGKPRRSLFIFWEWRTTTFGTVPHEIQRNVGVPFIQWVVSPKKNDLIINRRLPWAKNQN